MKIQDLLNKKVMLLDLQATTKEAAIDEMINSLVDNGVVTDFDVFKDIIRSRRGTTDPFLPNLVRCKDLTLPKELTW